MKIEKPVERWDKWLLEKAYSEEIEFLTAIIEKGDKDLQKELRAKDTLKRFERGLKVVEKESFGDMYLKPHLAELRRSMRKKDIEEFQRYYRIATNLVVFAGSLKNYDEYMKRRKAAKDLKSTLLGKGDEMWAMDFILGEKKDFRELYRILGIEYTK